MRRLVGVGYRPELAAWIESRPPEIQCLEITAEHFFDDGEEFLCTLTQAYPLFVHGLGLSLGTPGALSQETLHKFARVVDLAQPEWISEHLAFTRTEEVDLGHLNPLSPSRNTLAVVVEHAQEISNLCKKPLLLENITSHLRLDGEMSEPEFLNRVCEQSGCGILLDVTNLLINSKNHGFDPHSWLHELDRRRILQLHVVGYSVRNGRWQDHHAEPIQNDLWELVHDVLAYAPVQAIIIERDTNFPEPEELAGELKKLEVALGRYGIYNGASTSSE